MAHQRVDVGHHALLLEPLGHALGEFGVVREQLLHTLGPPHRQVATQVMHHGAAHLPHAPRVPRQQGLDIAAYDRLRVLATELRRVLDEGGEVAVRLGQHLFVGPRFAQLTRAV